MGSIQKGFAATVASLSSDKGLDWLERLPSLIARFEQQWSIEAMAPFEPLSLNYVAPAVRADGSEVILKLGPPHSELTAEAAALSHFDGRGSVRLLEADQVQGALLLEFLKPGLSLLSVEDDDKAMRIAARVMCSLWRPPPDAHAFPAASKWAQGLERLRARLGGGTGPLPRHLVEKAEGLFHDLFNSMSEPMLLHGDLHHKNILSAERKPWLAIDPKGVLAEPAYETGALLRNLWPEGLGQPRPACILARRAAVLSEALGFDRTRVLSWGLAQAVLAAWWCLESGLDGWEYFSRHAALIDSVLGRLD
jgi:streptomycin 6-kinase